MVWSSQFEKNNLAGTKSLKRRQKFPENEHPILASVIMVESFPMNSLDDVLNEALVEAQMGPADNFETFLDNLKRQFVREVIDENGGENPYNLKTYN